MAQDTSFESTEINSENEPSRRTFLRGAGMIALGAAALSAATAGGRREAFAQSVPEASAIGKKVKVGLPLHYGPFNQPWRRGCWALAKTVVDKGGEVVAIRGEPSKASEQQIYLQLLDRGIDVLVLGPYMVESETAYIVDLAKQKDIKTVGFSVTAKDSPALMEDTWGNATALGYQLQNTLGRQGTLVQTSEDRGFFAGFDMAVDMLDLMTNYEPRMKMLPFMGGSTSTDDQISKGRENVLALLQAHPEPGSISAIVSWWWPLAIGASQALVQSGRNDVIVTSHLFSDQLLGEMASGNSYIKYATDTDWVYIGEKVANLAISLGRGEDVANNVYRVPLLMIEQSQAKEALAKVQDQDRQAIEFLKQFGG